MKQPEKRPIIAEFIWNGKHCFAVAQTEHYWLCFEALKSGALFSVSKKEVVKHLNEKG